MKGLRFIFSKVFLINLAIAGVLSIVLLYLVMQYLNVYTRHGESILVPNLLGRTIDECMSSDTICKDIKLVLSDSSYNEEYKAGQILRQIPEPNARVKKGRKIYLTVNMDAPVKKAVPIVTDLSLRQAEASISGAGFFVGEVVYVPSPYKELVLNQKVGIRELRRGDSLSLGSRIDLYVGSGGAGTMIEIPNLIGVSLDEAITALNGAVLNRGATIYDISVVGSLDTANARIWKYTPKGRVEQGAFVDLYLTVDSSLIVVDTLSVDSNIEHQEVLGIVE